MLVEPVVALVVAAGSGVRLGGGLPKALRPLAGEAIVVHAVRALLAGPVDHVIVVVPADHEPAFTVALTAAVPVGSWQGVTGGLDRAESVRHGLAALAADPRLVGCRTLLVHDAARPLVPVGVVGRVVDAVAGGAVAVVPVVPVVDTIRQLAPGAATAAEDTVASVVLDRDRLRAVQTPQGFDREVLVAAHALAARDQVPLTDDAMACEYAGHRVTLVAGARESHKITEPADVGWAESVLAAGR